MAKLPWDDIAKFIGKQMSGKSNQKVRYDFAKKAGVLGGKNPSSKVKKRTTRKPASSKPKSTTGSKQQRKTGVTPTGRKAGRIANTRPERKRRDYVSPTSGIMTNDSQRRAATRETNRLLRRTDNNMTGRVPSDKTVKPVDVRGSIIKPPSKASMRPPRQGRRDTEGDALMRDFLADLDSGLGRKSRSTGRKPASGGPSVSKTPAKSQKPRSRANTRQQKSSSRPTGRPKPMTASERAAKEKKIKQRQDDRKKSQSRKSKGDSRDRYYNTDK